MFARLCGLFLTLGLVLSPLAAVAGAEVSTTRIQFKDGRAVVKGTVRGYGTAEYVFPVGAGESIKVVLKARNLSAYFNLTAPGASEALFLGPSSGDTFEGVAAVAGDYKASVFLMRNAARRGERSNFTLTVEVGKKSASSPKGPDFADGLSGGPDYWATTGEATMRAEPAAGAASVAQLTKGAVLKNLGCRNAMGVRWCRAQRADDASVKGWVEGASLRESGPPQK
jgi:hypothetical protein